MSISPPDESHNSKVKGKTMAVIKTQSLYCAYKYCTYVLGDDHIIPRGGRVILEKHIIYPYLNVQNVRNKLIVRSVKTNYLIFCRA